MLSPRYIRAISPLSRFSVRHSTTATTTVPSTAPVYIPLPSQRSPAPVKDTFLHSKAPIVSPASSIPSVNWKRHSPEQAETILAHAAATTGIATLHNLEHAAPFDAIRSLFDRMYCDPDLAQRLNATYPKRGVFKYAGLTNPTVDQKVTLDLSASRLKAMHAASPSLAADLGPAFASTLAFFHAASAQLVPLLLRATAPPGTDLASVHRAQNHNYRLIDYVPHLNGAAPRCGAHRDYGTFTLIFQDGNGGLEYQSERDGRWVPVPGEGVVAVWGWSALVLSGDRTVAAHHRVRRTEPGVRRNTAVLFVAPDVDVPLMPLAKEWEGAVFAEGIKRGDVSVGSFKELTGKTWRVREGTEVGEVGMGGHDEIVRKFVRGA